MRTIFNSLGDMMAYYQYIKFSLSAISAMLPEKNKNFFYKSNAKLSQTTKEEKLCFVGDVESFVKHYYLIQKGYVRVPIDCLLEIFHFALCPHISPYQSYRQIARRFRIRIKKGEALPRRLLYGNHIYDIALDLKESCEIYFINKGFIKNVVTEK